MGQVLASRGGLTVAAALNLCVTGVAAPSMCMQCIGEGRSGVHRSHEQQHYFNTPFQLSLPPTELQSEVLADRPESADQYEFCVEDGDVILLATDGIFDNVPDRLLVEEMAVVQHCKDEIRLQQCANSIALMARKLSRDPKFLSPFSVNALAAGIEAEGGKPDDITVLLATVSL